ncbi:TetR family transcriptional regulator [Natranaerovirga pectinivora]|uniref:TetR family transcriptional regulator n=1 Tax=Natranaerovirga pectinivora TaxID=682400 RepID=A0A4R3MM36_9FIRM|nr:TetR/AcrR family transcriptional regulator [Natranaerovirga pectinivora]TCT14895.1 TetR family transcriptional regulator [Natranaerovirga pectinivora]
MPTQRFENLPDEKKKRITEAIIDVFASKGVDETDVADIVREAKIARGSFYQYFEDKDDVIFHIINIIQTEKLTYIKDTMDNAMNMSFYDFYYSSFNGALEFAFSQPKYLTIGSYIMTSKNKKIKKLIEQGLESFYPFFERIINKDKENGAISKDLNNKSILLLFSNATSDMAIKLIYERHSELEEVRTIFDGVFQIIKKGISN